MKTTLALCVLCQAMLAAQEPMYRAAKEGGTYMFNYYLPPAPSSTPV